ncbi:ABC-2 transporter permease [Schnuerera sp.]|uniref:ABC-2 transporter permease n=1 Tax=Schnuerera sp. TaxID=2794844 RepID=UPI002CF95368|nr:ABC-2 transporter permease [Schnuerera sp.]HSH36473.1 ABC-2 transporter permease [Schnuerera sp.]
MLNLVKKDLKLSRKINIFGGIYALFIAAMGLTMPNYMIANLLYVLGMIILIFMLVIYTNGYDDKYKSEIIINSFPVDRQDIVKGKYLTLILFIILGSGIVLLFTKIISVLNIVDNNMSASLWNALFVTNISLIFYSIYYPFYFKIGEGIRSFNMILWIVILIGPSIISKFMKKLEAIGQLEKIMSININKLNIYLLVFSLIMFYISLQISKKIYLKREF